MRFTDTNSYNVSPSCNYFTDTIGYVVGTEEEMGTNSLGIFIPKLQLGMMNTLKDGMKDNDLDISINLLNKKEKSFIAKKVTETNYTVIKGLVAGNMGIPKFAHYEKVLIKVFDSDIKTMAFFPFSFDDSGNRIEGDEFKIMTPAKGPDEDESSPNSKDNNYAIAMDTREDKQLITISTTNKNNEKFAYKMVFDGKNGTWSVTDGSGRAIIMNSAEDALLFYTEEGSCIEARKDTIKLTAKNVHINAENEIIFTTKNYSLETDDFKEKSSTAEAKHKSFKQISDKGTYEIGTEKHKGQRITTSEMIGIQNEVPMFAVNGLAAVANITYGGAPNIDIEIPTPPDTASTQKGNMEIGTGKMEIKSGMMNIGSGSMSVGPGAVPLAKAPQLMEILTIMAAQIDMALSAGSINLPGTCSPIVAAKISSINSMTVRGA